MTIKIPGDKTPHPVGRMSGPISSKNMTGTRLEKSCRDLSVDAPSPSPLSITPHLQFAIAWSLSRGPKWASNNDDYCACPSTMCSMSFNVDHSRAFPTEEKKNTEMRETYAQRCLTNSLLDLLPA